MELATWLQQHPEIKHGKIRILFTPDEEIGRGVNKLDMKKLAAIFFSLWMVRNWDLLRKKHFAVSMQLHFTAYRPIGGMQRINW